MADVHWMLIDKSMGPGAVMAPGPNRRTPSGALDDMRLSVGSVEPIGTEWVPMEMAPFRYTQLPRAYTAFLPVYKTASIGPVLVGVLLRYSYWGDPES